MRARATRRRGRPGPGRRRGSAQAGLTLLEVVVGLSILLVGTLGFVAALVTSLKAGAVLRQHTTALAAAQQRLEELQALPRATLLLRHDVSFAVDGLEPAAPGGDVGSISIDATEPPLVRIEVTLTWRGPYGTEQLSLDTTVLPP